VLNPEGKNIAAQLGFGPLNVGLEDGAIYQVCLQAFLLSKEQINKWQIGK
jgi:hypothetical protein